MTEKNERVYSGNDGGSWKAETHQALYGKNLNYGLGKFITEQISPRDLLEFGSGLGDLANLIAENCPLQDSFCIEPEIANSMRPGLHVLNIDIFSGPIPAVLDKRFDLVLSIEVAEHIKQQHHEYLFDFLVSRAGKWIVFSGARPGQGGHGHIAERDELEWRAEFTARGCTFDPRLSLLARNMCDSKNINHRRNIQVFRAPERNPALEDLENRARPYLNDLLSVIQSSGKSMTGNFFYVDMDDTRSRMPQHSLMWKRDTLLQLARKTRNMLEIGFAGGHSALLCLLANPQLRLTIVDPLELPYAKACFDYLDAAFPGRLEIHPGWSGDILPTLPDHSFDLIHFDGGKDKTIAQDLEAARRLVTRDHVLVIDDTQNRKLDEIVREWEKRGDLEIAPFREQNRKSLRARWTHKIARFPQPAQPDTLITEMREIFVSCPHASIYTREKRQGQIVGLARAASLVQIIRNVETANLGGAFVEVGVAAGHSSVIAGLACSNFIERDFFLYDTFQGFAKNLPDEVDHEGKSIRAYDLKKYSEGDCNLHEVRARILQSGITSERLFLVEGPAEEMVPKIGPQEIAVLRLDADLFEPTRVSLEQMYDRISPGGWLVVDDYGHWKGCQEAVDLFFAARGTRFAGSGVDYTCYVCQILPTFAKNRPVIVSFVNEAYIPVARNWLAALKDLAPDADICLVTTDWASQAAFAGESTLFRPLDGTGLTDFWVHRVQVLAEFLTQGYDVVHSDSDAVWLQDPLAMLCDNEHDLVFSQGTVWPPEIHRKHGFVACCGLFMVRSNPQGLAFIRLLGERVGPLGDDQIAVNRILDEMVTQWQVKFPDTLTFRDTVFTTSKEMITGSTELFSVGILPHHLFPRHMTSREQALVAHPLSGKTCAETSDTLRTLGLWVLPSGET